jgi:hypothetical protein
VVEVIGPVVDDAEVTSVRTPGFTKVKFLLKYHTTVDIHSRS